MNYKPRHFVYDKAVIHTFKNSKQRPRCAMHLGLSIALNLDVRPTPPTINIVGSLQRLNPWYLTSLWSITTTRHKPCGCAPN